MLTDLALTSSIVLRILKLICLNSRCRNNEPLFLAEGKKFYMNATLDHHKAFVEVEERWNISMHGYEDVPWEHLTPEECKM